MLSTIQSAIDNFLEATQLKTVTDMVFVPQDDEVVVLRSIGHRNVNIDVSYAASPSEVVDIVSHHVAVY